MSSHAFNSFFHNRLAPCISTLSANEGDPGRGSSVPDQLDTPRRTSSFLCFRSEPNFNCRPADPANQKDVMTLSHLGEEIETARRPGPPEAGPAPEPGLSPVEDAGSWEVDFREGLSGEASPEVGTGLLISCTGAGEAVVSAPHPLPVPAGTAALRLWIEAPGPGDAQAPELFVLLSGGQERSMGRLDFSGRHLCAAPCPRGRASPGWRSAASFTARPPTSPSPGSPSRRRTPSPSRSRPRPSPHRCSPPPPRR